MRRPFYRVTIPGLPLHVRVGDDRHEEGEVRYWLESQPKGPGRVEMPLLQRLAAMEQSFYDVCTPPDERKREGQRKATRAASEARTANAKELAIVDALSKRDPKDRTACTRIAEQFDVGPAYVRKLRAKRASP